ncbi:MAG: DUF2177 family protein [Alphaproteobacteria bacterium]|nr:DUF2177 family protein [Alphaproteobacteria bacterium]MBV9420666.1 DUF2177 family protein [Alphaproteobacteria bacterium]MBV9540582.1 DUF2177 family protein [Alphaproteobacteria bacterium]MBV9903845.1 DUF2177 family protein [Alphaproteobacteria bacterium]
MLRIAAAYAAAALVMAVLDLGWLSYAQKAFFEPTVGALLAEKTNIPAAVAFYVLYVAAIVLFAVARADAWSAALLWGAAFGFFAYMTYDLTNLATLKHWTFGLAAMDIAWGTFVTAAAASAGYFASSRIA